MHQRNTLVSVDHYEIRLDHDEPSFFWNGCFAADDLQGLADTLWLISKLGNEYGYSVLAWEQHPDQSELSERLLTDAEDGYVKALLRRHNAASSPSPVAPPVGVPTPVAVAPPLPDAGSGPLAGRLIYEYFLFDSADSLAAFADDLMAAAENAVEDDDIDGWLKVKVPTAIAPAWASREDEAPVLAPLVGVTYEEVAPGWSRATRAS